MRAASGAASDPGCDPGSETGKPNPTSALGLSLEVPPKNPQAPTQGMGRGVGGERVDLHLIEFDFGLGLLLG